MKQEETSYDLCEKNSISDTGSGLCQKYSIRDTGSGLCEKYSIRDTYQVCGENTEIHGLIYVRKRA